MKVIDFLEKANSTLFSYEIIPPFRGGSIDKVFNLVAFFQRERKALKAFDSADRMKRLALQTSSEQPNP